MPKFRCTVRAYGTFVIEADDMYVADDVAVAMSNKEVVAAVEANGGWDVDVNPNEFPEEA